MSNNNNSIKNDSEKDKKQQYGHSNGITKATDEHGSNGYDTTTYEQSGKDGKEGNTSIASVKTPLIDDELLILDNVPIDVFPSWITDFIDEHYEQVGYPPSYTAGGVLAALSLVSGNNREVFHKFSIAGNIWLGLVGKPGANKTHPLKTALQPIYEFEEELKGRSYGLPLEDRSDQLIVCDTTMEALSMVLKKNPLGVLLHKDELIGWLKEMDGYRQRGDTENWCSMFSQQNITVNRVTREKVYIEKPFVSVVGTTQPNAFKNIRADGPLLDIGFLDRMLFIWPEHLSAFINDKEAKITTYKSYESGLRQIYNKRNEKRIFRLAHNSAKMLTDWQNDINYRYETKPDHVLGIASKLHIYAYKLILILHLSHSPENTPDEIPLFIIEKSIRLLNYFERQAKRIRYMICGDNQLVRLTDTQRHIYAKLPQIFKTQEAQEIAKQYEMPDRTLRYLLNTFRVYDLIIKVRHGVYRKNS